MTGFWATIISAVILGPLAAMINNLRKKNSEEHGETLRSISNISDKLDRMDERLADHIEWHLDHVNDLKEESNG